MNRTRNTRTHAPPRPIRAVLALFLVVATAVALVACGNPGATGGGGPTVAPGETMGSETTAPTSGY
jgi:hypothetical protein